MLLGLFWMALFVTAPAVAQSWPDRAITIVVPFTAGDPANAVARPLADAMARQLGQPVLVRNLGGRGSADGAAFVARAQADGYTLLLNHVAHAAAPAVHRRLRYDPIRDFAPIGRVADVPMVLLGRADLPARDLTGLIAWLRANGKGVLVAHAGRGTESHLCALTLMAAAGVRMTQLVYPGTGPALTELAAGQVDLLCNQAANSSTPIKSGWVTVYGVTGKTRAPNLPATPTMAEGGAPGVGLSVWHGLYAPSGTPKAVVTRLVAALHAAVADPAFTALLAEHGGTPATLADATPAALGTLTRSEKARWARLIEADDGRRR